jgi:hypothetical protein
VVSFSLPALNLGLEPRLHSRIVVDQVEASVEDELLQGERVGRAMNAALASSTPRAKL